jgi:hypothetical protein
VTTKRVTTTSKDPLVPEKLLEYSAVSDIQTLLSNTENILNVETPSNVELENARITGLVPTKANRLPKAVMLQAPDVGPNPANSDADTDPLAYPHKRVMLATPNTFETTALNEVPKPDALLHITMLSEIHECRAQEVQT